MRNILSDTQTGKDSAAGTVRHIGGHGSDNLDSVRGRGVENRPSANAVDRHSIDQVGRVLSSADAARKEAQSIRINRREPEPSHFDSDRQNTRTWQEWYEAL